MEKMRARLRASVSGFIRVSRIGGNDRTAMCRLVERGEVEIFRSDLGKAYRLAALKAVGTP